MSPAAATEKVVAGLPPDVMAEIQALAANVATAYTDHANAVAASSKAIENANGTLAAYGDLSRELYARLRVAGVEPKSFVLNGLVFAPNGTDQDFDVSAAAPTFDAAMGG